MPEPASRIDPKEEEGYTLTYVYDPLDWRVKTTYPDGSYEQTIYNRLDAEWVRDRAGRWTRTEHDANQEVASVTDPAGRTVKFQRCEGCGALEGIVDGAGHIDVIGLILPGGSSLVPLSFQGFQKVALTNLF